MKKQAFTLVELIVVITILAILATVGFVSFSWYLAWTRDTNRIAQLKSMSDALELYRTKKDLPIPDDKVDIQASWNTIAYQWYIWANVLETIEYTEKWLDPKDKWYFSYYLTKNKKHFQLLSFLEEASEDTLAWNNIFNNSQAVDYEERVPHVKWKKLWILTDENNTPIQDVSIVTSDWYLDISDVWTTVYKSIISDEEITSWSWTALSWLHTNWSCKRIKQVKGWSDDWVYTIDPEANGVWFEVYCDMTTDWWWWTLIWRWREWWAWDDLWKDSSNVYNWVWKTAWFTPAYLSSATIDWILNGVEVKNLVDWVRLRRAANIWWTMFQENRWNLDSQLNWSWMFDSSLPLNSISIDGVLQWTWNTRDKFDWVSNNELRIFTRGRALHNNIKGFSYGLSISGWNSGSDFLWEYAAENHAIPYTEVYIRN